MKNTVKMRRMLSEDVESVAELFAEANPHATVAEVADWTKKYLAKYQELCYVLEEGGEVIGAISCGFNDGDGYIGDIAIRDDRRRKGYGTLLMNKALEVFKEMKVQKIVLGVHWKCSYAIPFYYSLGFRVTSIKPDGYGEGHDYVELERELER